MRITGAEAMVKCFNEEGVSTVFGYPGGAILPLYDALRDSQIRHILTAHEQGAVHAADGYARASGKVGVCIATSGPGATNLVTGLATAFLDSIPVVAVTGQVSRPLIGHDAFQEVDITSITMPVTKHNFLVKDPAHLVQTMRLAFQIAATGRPGPVLVDVPRDVQTALVEFTVDGPDELTVPVPDGGKIAAAVEMINNSNRPVVLIGGGVVTADAEYDVMRLCEKLKLPVVSTLMGLGAISAYRELFLGMTGLHGHERANNAIKEADLIIAVGSRFNDRVTGDSSVYSIGKNIIQLDVDPAEMAKNIGVSIGITGDIKMSLNTMEEKCQIRDLGPWWQLISGWKHMDEDHGKASAPAFIKALNPVIKDRNYIISTDVGQHQMWAAQHLKIQYARQLVTSGGLGTMGFGLPAAMGAQLACPQSRVISISGDGGFKMTGSELFTIASYNIPVIAVIFNNSGLGMIRQLQKVYFEDRYMACKLEGFVDFVKYAESFGIGGERVDTPEELAGAVRSAMEKNCPYVIEVAVSAEDMVLPMVAPGKGINDFVEF